MSFKSILKLMDIKTLVAGVIPVFLGTVYSFYAYEKINVLHFVLLILAMVLIQSSTNMINDYYDYKRGADCSDKAEEKALVSGEVNTKQVIAIILIYQVIALLIGIFIASQSSYNILLVALFGIIVSLLYAFGPMPISYTPFGEIISGITMGIGITCTVIFIHTGKYNISTILVCIPTVLYIGTILLSNNISDIYGDINAGRKTLPILIGKEKAEKFWIFNVIMLIALTALLYRLEIYPIIVLILVIVLFPYNLIKVFLSYDKNVSTKGRTMGIIGKIGLRYHLAVIIGLLISIIIK